MNIHSSILITCCHVAAFVFGLWITLQGRRLLESYVHKDIAFVIGIAAFVLLWRAYVAFWRIGGTAKPS